MLDQVTGCESAGFYFFQFWRFSGAELCRVWASGSEIAAARRIYRAWNLSSEHIFCLLPLFGIWQRNCLQQKFGVWMDRVCVDVACNSQFANFAEEHDTDPV